MGGNDANARAMAGETVDPDEPPKKVAPEAELEGPPDDGGPWDYPEAGDAPAAPAVASKKPAPASEGAAPSKWASLWQNVGPWLAEKPPERRWLLNWPKHPHPQGTVTGGDGCLPCGVVGVLAASGGAGKTRAAVALAVSVATGEPWLADSRPGADQVAGPVPGFEVATPGRALLILGEETPEECHRRLWHVVEDLRLPVHLRRLVADRVEVLPLAGVVAPLTQGQRAENPGDLTVDALALEAELRARAPYALVVVDPLSRMAGEGSEVDNALATRFMQVVEKLAKAAGGDDGPATALVVHHMSQSGAQGASTGAAAVRGATGLVDGARWVATLLPDPNLPREYARFELVKTNYSRAGGELLARGPHGELYVQSHGPGSDYEHRADLAEVEKDELKKAAQKRREELKNTRSGEAGGARSKKKAPAASKKAPSSDTDDNGGY